MYIRDLSLSDHVIRDKEIVQRVAWHCLGNLVYIYMSYMPVNVIARVFIFINRDTDYNDSFPYYNKLSPSVFLSRRCFEMTYSFRQPLKKGLYL